MIKFALAKEHRLHFGKHQILELEGILTPSQILQLKEKIDNIVSYSDSSNWKQSFSPERHFREGRDLWRKDPLIRKLVTDKGLGKIASELLGGKFLRLGYDQLLPNMAQDTSETTHISSSFAPLLIKPATLEEISCIQGALCGVCICLRSAESTTENQEPQNSPFSKHEGNAVFFSAEKSIDFSELKRCPQQEFLLIVYAAKTTLYVPNESDAHQHAFKKLGYVFGDRLNDEQNPVICRI